jgi:hypothetical protein
MDVPAAMDMPSPFTPITLTSIIFTWRAPYTSIEMGGSKITGYNFVQTGAS